MVMSSQKLMLNMLFGDIDDQTIDLIFVLNHLYCLGIKDIILDC